jgi:hypothetical protein
MKGVLAGVVLVVAIALSVVAPAQGALFSENFRSGDPHAFGGAMWWNQDSWDVRSDTYAIATTPNDESAAWGGHYTAIRRAGSGEMHVDFQGIESARLRNPMLISAGRPGVVEFEAPVFATTGHWWEVAITPSAQPTAGEYTAVPARQHPEGLNNPVTGRDDDGSTNGPGHRANLEKAINVISTGFPDAPACNGSGWHVRWALTDSISGRVRDHVNPARTIGRLFSTDPKNRTKMASWRIVYTPSRVTLFGDRNRDGKLEKVDSWAVRIPWRSVYVNLLYVAYQAGHHPQVGCGYGRNGVLQGESTQWQNVRVSPVAYSSLTTLPSPGRARADGWMSYDLRDLDAHLGGGVNSGRYDKYSSYLACSVGGVGGIPCPDRVRRHLTLKTTATAAQLRGLRRAQLVTDIRYRGNVGVKVNGRSVGTIPGVSPRPDIQENNGFGDSFEVEAWQRRSIDIPASALAAGVNTVELSLDPSTNVELDRIQLELARS